MKEIMLSWINALEEINSYLEKHPDKDIEADATEFDTLSDTIFTLKRQIDIWKIELYEKDDIVKMIRGSRPIYTNESFNYLINIAKVGYYVGGFVDEFRWKAEDEKCWDMSIRNLAIIYLHYCKN